MASGFQTLVDDALSQTFNTFGEPAIYWPKSEPSFPITGVFFRNFQTQTATQNAVLQSSEIRLSVKLDQFPAEPDEGDRVQVRGQTYGVIEYRPDGLGGADLILQSDTSNWGPYAA